MAFDRWTLLKIFQVGFVLACLICKRVTDDEASRLFLYLQKLSREWSLLNSVTWDRLGSSVADAIYGGYFIITSGLLIGKLFNEIPTVRRAMEILFYGIGALLYIIIGSLVLAAIDSLPSDLVDNAAVLGGLSLITAILFLIDLGGPKAKKEISQLQPVRSNSVIISKPLETHQMNGNKQDVHTVESELRRLEQKELAALEEHSKKVKTAMDHNGFLNGQTSNGIKPNSAKVFKNAQNGYKKIKEKESPKIFNIYGKDAAKGDHDVTDSGADDLYHSERYSPVWSQIRKGQYGKIEVPSYVYTGSNPSDIIHSTPQPSKPGDPGYVQYTAQNWGQPSQRTPRPSPTQV